MKGFDFAIAPKELAEAMMADLGNGPTTVNLSLIHISEPTRP